LNLRAVQDGKIQRGRIVAECAVRVKKEAANLAASKDNSGRNRPLNGTAKS
jgi:hypothetical protein